MGWGEAIRGAAQSQTTKRIGRPPCEKFAKVPLAKIRRSRPVEFPLSRNWKNVIVHRRDEEIAGCWSPACDLGIYAGGHAVIAL